MASTTIPGTSKAELERRIAQGYRALRSALEPQAEAKPLSSSTLSAQPAPGLLDSFNQPKEGGVKVVFLSDNSGKREPARGGAEE